MIFNRLLIVILLVPILYTVLSCDQFLESDTQSFQMVSIFDLRDRESYVQITNTDAFDGQIHLQIFDVANNCNENNFFDNFTGNDTHVYNLRDIQTNDGNPSGVVLPENAYGIVVISQATSSSPDEPSGLIGNFRVLDNSGYEYRTNLLGLNFTTIPFFPFGEELTLNFNKEGGVSLSDVIGFTLNGGGEEFFSADIVNINLLLNVDILNLDEDVFSCRNVIFACTDQDNPKLEELLEKVGGASVASFEYGINEAIPHTKGGELLCPGNNIQEGLIRLTPLVNESHANDFGIFLGLNNGNGRGSMDSYWHEHAIGLELPELPPPE